jgi:hypothetical protein
MPLRLMEAPSSAYRRGTAGAGFTPAGSGGDLLRCATTQHHASGGLDLHARTLAGGLLHQAGARLVPPHVTARPAPCLTGRAPSRDARVVALAWRCTGAGLADRCRHAGLACVLGQALDRHAIPGGNATNDRLAAQHMAVRLRGGRLPQADGSPAERRATRDLLRRQGPLMRPRAERLTPLPPPQSQDTRPEIGPPSAAHAHPRALRRTVPGRGAILRLVLLEERPAIQRCPRGHACAATAWKRTA